MNRRQFALSLAAGAASLGLGIPRVTFARDSDPSTWATGLAQWISANQTTSSGMVRYYRGGPYPNGPSTIATAYALLFFVRRDRAMAERLANALIAEQAKHLSNPHVSGGLPSMPADPKAPFYSSDALIVLEGMLELYAVTSDERYLACADHLFRFIAQLVDGKKAGVLAQNFGFPMTYVTAAGAYNNVLTINVGMMFFTALQEYARVRGSRAAQAIYTQGRSFLLREAQSSHGPFYNSYDPGYPPKPYSRARWKWYSHSNGRSVVIGDNVLASAIGAAKMGGIEQAKRAAAWLKPRGGAIYGYLDANTGGPAFVPRDRPYYDIVVTGMYAELLRQIDEFTSSKQRDVVATLAEARAADGGWYWGHYVDGGFVDNAEALITGYWAVRGATGTT